MIFQGKDDAFFAGSLAGFLEVLDRIVDGLLLGHALGRSACEDPDDGTPDGGVVIHPEVDVLMPFFQLGAVRQSEDVADGSAADVEPVQVSLAFQLGEIFRSDFLGEEVGGGFATVEVLCGAPVDEPQHVHGPGRPRFGCQLLAKGIGRQAQLQLGATVALDRADGLNERGGGEACEGHPFGELAARDRIGVHDSSI